MKYVVSTLVLVSSLILASRGASVDNRTADSERNTQTHLNPSDSDAQNNVEAAPEQDQDKPLPGLTSNQALMRDKLKHMSLILDGLTLDNFDQAAESGLTLAMISRATSWHIAEPTEKYLRLSKNFQEQARDLERHARERNIEAATLDLVRMNISCTACHQHMREHLGSAK